MDENNIYYQFAKKFPSLEAMEAYKKKLEEEDTTRWVEMSKGVKMPEWQAEAFKKKF